LNKGGNFWKKGTVFHVIVEEEKKWEKGYRKVFLSECTKKAGYSYFFSEKEKGGQNHLGKNPISG